jgi:hypothetical protein
MQILSHDYYGQYRELEPAPFQPLSVLLCFFLKGTQLFWLCSLEIIMIIIYLNDGQKCSYCQPRKVYYAMMSLCWIITMLSGNLTEEKIFDCSG